ncbi:DUF4085 family protein [Cytobacillus sp. IB215316]|uniref:DUF4085 family protein n=1 Tax=Cytobacillus sp. IB215316 TaxID=3097354 RepID=UPI002A0F2A10|nr:DUF4085 family protein [Cytobacillus sp. IB215316]MDX8363383.1 DUF4085 family protein [Cytobacillus sp. IB215316]
MRYFTKERYKEMQVYGFLAFPESKKEWDEMIQYYKEEGIDYKKNAKEDLESIKKDLLKFLPESFHPYIYNGTINSEFPTPELRSIAEQWLSEYDERNKRIRDEYNEYFKSIKSQLPINVVKFYEKSLHDATIKSFECHSKDECLMILDWGVSDIKLTFKGVSKLTMPEKLEGALWLYDEVYHNDKYFELHVLFDCPLTEFSIIAENIVVEHLQ